MHYLKRIFDFIIFSNVFVSFCAASLVFATKIILQLKGDFYLEFFVFFSSLAVYNFQRITFPETEVFVFLSIRHKWTLANSKLLFLLTVFSLIISVLIFLFCFTNKTGSAILLLPFAFISIWYALDLHRVFPFLKNKFKRLRLVPYLKIGLIALTWTAITVWLPIIEYRLNLLSDQTFILTLERLLFIFAITLPFDIRDMLQDKAFQLKTIPLALGIERTKYLSYFTLLIFSLIAFSRVPLLSTDIKIVGALVVSALIASILISIINENKREYYYSFWIESLMVIQFLLLFFSTIN
ncbi:MAG: hypothetical protein M3Q58_01615 [Bacteroidota bacterium]|nr:hypothetical protein [Bacteroidota bacterium]